MLNEPNLRSMLASGVEGEAECMPRLRFADVTPALSMTVCKEEGHLEDLRASGHRVGPIALTDGQRRLQVKYHSPQPDQHENRSTPLPPFPPSLTYNLHSTATHSLTQLTTYTRH